MSLVLRRLELCEFRNYPHFLLEDLGMLTIFVGPNAVGKTNVVEAVQLMTALTSFRHPKIEHLVMQGAENGRVEARFSDENRLLDLQLSLQPGKRSYQLNGKAKRPADLRGLLPCVTFTPDDLGLVKGSIGARRTALDDLGAQLSANHQVIRRDYENVIRHKNALLKEEASDDLLWSINQMVVTCGAQLCCYRNALFAKLSKHLGEAYRSLTDSSEEVGYRYVPSWAALGDAPSPEPSGNLHEDALFGRDEARSLISASLEKHTAEERARGRSVVGPHADRVEFFLQGRDASVFASQGQQRSLVLAWKLAEVALVEEMLGQRPLLLLDDVMSELDAQRRNRLIDFIQDDIQVMITTTTPEYFTADIIDRAQMINLPQKEVSRETS